MYAAIQLDDFMTTSRHSVDLVLKSSMLLGKVKEWFGKVGSFLFLHITVFPFVAVLAYFRYRLRKKFPVDIKITSNNYIATRKSYDNLIAVTALLQPIANTQIADSPWVLRFALAQIKKVFATMQACIERISSALKELDTIPNNTTPRFFQLRTEAQLWADRPSCYDYLA
jgi:hypothetical protein